jgi:hypothetical protein
MLSAILEILPSMPLEGFMSLLISAYPDLHPWCVREAYRTSPSGEYFYLKYLSSLLHYDDGNDAAKLDGALVKVIDPI